METLIEGSRVRFGRVTRDDEKGGKEFFFRVSFPKRTRPLFSSSPAASGREVGCPLSCGRFSLSLFDPTVATE